MRFAPFDRRGHPTLTPRRGYRAWAPGYDRDLAKFPLDLPLLRRWRSASWRSLGSVVDLGCGTGRMGAWLRVRGVRAVDGLDGSPDMLGRARRKGVYRHLWLRSLSRPRLPRAAYGLAISSLVACHLPALGGLYRAMFRALRRGGWAVIIDYHPHFLLNGVPTHFITADDEVFAITNHVHLFRNHAEAAQQAGFTLARLDELIVSRTWVRRYSGWAKHLHHPVSFLLGWRKQ